jgi:hypothetical protein
MTEAETENGNPALEEASRELQAATHDAQVAFDCIALGDIDRAHTHALTAKIAADAAVTALAAALGLTEPTLERLRRIARLVVMRVAQERRVGHHHRRQPPVPERRMVAPPRVRQDLAVAHGQPASRSQMLRQALQELRISWVSVGNLIEHVLRVGNLRAVNLDLLLN